MKLLKYLLFAALLSGVLSACGQKGPLFLPDADTDPAPSAPPEEDRDDDGA